MPISINIPPSVPADAHARVEAMVAMLRDTDSNFIGIPITVLQCDMTPGVVVVDDEDPLRGELLAALIAEALRASADSIMGDLR